jgi:uncharacterized membrane protein YgaE (UPF0421/DUF939 family)
MTYLICVIIGILIGGLGIYFVLKPKLKTFVSLDQDTERQNMKIHEENKYLRDTNVQFTKDKIALETTIDELKNSISNLELQSEQAAQAIYNKTMESMSESLSHAAEKMGEDYQTAENEFKNEYLQVMEEFSNLM